MVTDLAGSWTRIVAVLGSQPSKVDLAERQEKSKAVGAPREKTKLAEEKPLWRRAGRMNRL